MIELSEPVLYALWKQAVADGRALVVDEQAVGHALAEMSTGGGDMKHCVLRPHGDGHVEVGFV
jgi:hypothetical protein